MKHVSGFKTNINGQTSHTQVIDQQNQNNQNKYIQTNTTDTNSLTISIQNPTNNKNRTIPQATVPINENSNNALPRIRMNS
jgi:hypothetical protein